MPPSVHEQEITVELDLVLGVERLHLCLKRGNHGGDPWVTRHQFFIGVRGIGNRLQPRGTGCRSCRWFAKK